MEVKGYKVFNQDWTCRGFQYEVGGTYEDDRKPSCCERGFHFCLNAADCFNYYKFNPENKVAEVIAIGEVSYSREDTKACTNKIQIVREIPWQEVLEIVNTGKGCTGFRNSGNYNSGDWNSGDYNSGNWNSGNRNSGDYNSGNYNSGDWNSGDYNSGDWNSGNYNSGDYNSGNWNSGNRNSGDYNSGNYNSGDWNNTNYSNGCFNTKEPKIYLFNKPSEWTYRDWLNSEAKYLLNQIDNKILKWVYSEDMTNDEKEAHPEHETTGGYLEKLDVSENSQIWWNKLTKNQRDIIKSIPNFDPAIFKEIMGIEV